jgi:uncharacterized membrane protein YeaQ/YmgE (transglycosylase-associated protein family)
MSLIAWIALGLIAGILARHVFAGSGDGEAADVVHGVAGAVFGGWLFNTFGMDGGGEVSLYGLLVASVCAILLLFAYRSLTPAVR